MQQLLKKILKYTETFRVVKITEKDNGHSFTEYRPERGIKIWKFTFWLPISYKLCHFDMDTWNAPLTFEKVEEAIDCIKKYKEGYYNCHRIKKVVYEEKENK